MLKFTPKKAPFKTSPLGRDGAMPSYWPDDVAQQGPFVNAQQVPYYKEFGNEEPAGNNAFAPTKKP